ncbi:MAG: hypothetical protein JWO71_3127 [Candidatus Acidoferrum typicum]|nr:hypothetical protein [Candidatus Acidoferrum typicum]
MESLEYRPDEETSVIAAKQIRAVAFLLESCTDAGNRPLEGNAARGLAEILKRSADGLAGASRKLKVA